MSSFDAMRSLLNERHPRAFPRNPFKIQPLAIGIKEQILSQNPDLARGRVGRFLGSYCNRPMYLRAVIAGQPRRNLDGSIAPDLEEVSA